MGCVCALQEVRELAGARDNNKHQVTNKSLVNNLVTKNNLAESEFMTPNRNVFLPKVILLIESPVSQNKRCIPNPMYFQFHFYQEQNPQKQMFYQNLFHEMKTFFPKTKLVYQNQSHCTKNRFYQNNVVPSRQYPVAKSFYQNQNKFTKIKCFL